MSKYCMILGLVLMALLQSGQCLIDLNLELFPFVIGFGKCPSVSAQPTLDKARYLGKWYEYKRFPTVFEAGLECVTAEYGDEGTVISVTNTGYARIGLFGKKIDGLKSVAKGSATIPDITKPAELAVSFGGQKSTTANYFIQDTDYDTYSVVFSCFELFGVNLQFAWILTRTAGVTPPAIDNIYTNLQAAGVDTKHFKTVDQSGCP